MKDIVTEMKNKLQAIDNREDEAKIQIRNLEYQVAKNN